MTACFGDRIRSGSAAKQQASLRPHLKVFIVVWMLLPLDFEQPSAFFLRPLLGGDADWRAEDS